MSTPLFQSSQYDAITGVGGHMATSVTIYDDGKLFASTHIWEDTLLRGFHGGVFALFLDDQNQPLTNTTAQVYGVDGRLLGNSDRTEAWQWQVPPDILTHSTKIAIVHRQIPNGTQQEIDQWLGAITHDIGLVTSIIQSLTKIVSPGSPSPTPSPKPGGVPPPPRVGGKQGVVPDPNL